MGLLDTAAGSTPWGAIAEAGIGGIQALIGGINAHKYQKQLENMQSPMYNQSKSIGDYYKNALLRYNTNPYQSQQYQYAVNQAKSNMAAGINALNSRRSAVGGISNLVALTNNAGQRAGVQAEQEQNQRFGQLGQAANMQANQDEMAYQYNQLMPFERRYNLLAQRAGGANQMMNAGLSNLFGGFQNAGNMQMINRMYPSYGNNNNNDTGDSSTYSPTYSQAKRSGLI
jgi:hypothetical protein